MHEWQFSTYSHALSSTAFCLDFLFFSFVNDLFMKSGKDVVADKATTSMYIILINIITILFLVCFGCRMPFFDFISIKTFFAFLAWA